jgi:NDP-sugar pyrophosphorylase family protein
MVEQPFDRLIVQKQLICYPYEGFWAPMDTFKDKQQLDELYSRGESPWTVWKSDVEANRASHGRQKVKPHLARTTAR